MDDHVSLFCFRGARALHFSHLNHPLRPRDDLGGIGFTSRPSDDTIFVGCRKTICPGEIWASAGRKVFQRWQQPQISDRFGHV